jgi:phosphomethylpyrimidine synthase
VTPGLTSEQREILERRGAVAPAEIERLANKTRRAMAADRGQRAACHSDRSDADTASELQGQRLDPVTLEPSLDQKAL